MADTERVGAATEYIERLIRAADEAAHRAVNGLVTSIMVGPLTAAAVPDPSAYESLPQDWERQVEAHMVPLTEAAYEAGTIQALVQLPHAAAEFLASNPNLPTVINPQVEEALVAARMEFARLGPETAARVQAAIVEGVAAGEGVDAIGDRIIAAVELSEARASVIARTESVRASNRGAHNQARLLAKYLPVTKEWLDTSDSRTRKTHVAAGGQEVGLDEPFEVGGAFLQFPGDPAGPPQETINCRCTTLYNEVGPPETAVEPIDLSNLRSPVAALVNSPDDFVAAATPQVDSTTGEEHTGAMIALVPSQADRDRLAIEGGEPVDQLHVTLAYLGEAADMPEGMSESLQQVLTKLAGDTPVLEVEAFGVTVWNKVPADRDTSINMSVGGDGLAEVHDLAWDALDLAATDPDWAPPTNHAPWVAHLCLAYTDDESLLDQAHEREGPLTLDTLRLAIGGEIFDFPLAAAAGGDMPYHIVPNSADCDGDFAVVKDADSEVMGCHATEDEAKDQMAALYAEEDPTAAAERVEPSNRWHGTLMVLNTPSDDGRQFNAVTWRELPQPLMREIKSTHGGMTSETVYVGNIDRIEIQGNEVLGWGDFDMADPEGAKSARWLAEGRFRHVSIDGGGVKEGDIEYIFPDGYDENGVSEDGESFAMPELTIYHNAIIMGATQVPFPAFGQAEIFTDLQSSAPVTGEGESEAAALVAAGFPVDPPADWFQDPEFDGPHAFTISDSGRVFGHLALWGTCHTGMDKVCRTPPVEASYEYFETGEIVCDDGSTFPCGQITMGTGHAPALLRQFAAAEHYDNTGTAVADVRCGRDQYGIWVAGAARPCLDGEQLRTLRAATLSGDWRKFAGHLRLVAALAVNVPGFPVPRTSAATRAGDQVTLVASGVVTPDALAQRTQRDYDRIAERIARSIGHDRPARVAKLAAKIGV